MNRICLLTIIALLAITGCTKRPADVPEGPPLKDQNQQEAPKHEEHKAPHGGAMAELGEEAAHLEFVLDAAEGRLTMYALDAHAENPVRLDTNALSVLVTPQGGEVLELTMAPRENALTGESIGDSSEFFVVDQRLQNLKTFEISVPLIDVRGMPFRSVTVAYGQGANGANHAAAGNP